MIYRVLFLTPDYASDNYGEDFMEVIVSNVNNRYEAVAKARTASDIDGDDLNLIAVVEDANVYYNSDITVRRYSL